MPLISLIFCMANWRCVQVKQEIVNCLRARMTKEQMFQRLREMGVHPAIAFAVYKELRLQNKDYFKRYALTLLVKRQIGQFNNQLAVYRQLQRRSNAFAGDNQESCNGVESSYVGEAAPRGMLAEPVVGAAPATVQHANYYHPATMEASLDYGALPGSSRDLVPVAQRQAAQHGFHPQPAVQNGWTAGHAPTAVRIFGATVTSSYPPQPQGGFWLSSRQSFAEPQDGAQH
ncbi:hypothetical protein GUJ93_ZPchr0002g25344 [Zizania palustris]|uniref:Uncharacterized protein n=1 Tax=Zizania palustris TaxID=103762 RepID=A0A8J5SBE5_ZIZPA|nr:hypothetical protein GUJ93_ZPchr0002g25344 [Zizania palustris]